MLSKKQTAYGCLFFIKRLQLFFIGNDADESSLGDFACESDYFLFAELDDSVGQCIESVIFSATDIFSGMKFGSFLADDYVSGIGFFTAENFNSQSF